MSNKKASVDFGSMFGYIYYVIAAIFIVIFVIIFNAFFNTKQVYADIRYSTEEIDAIGDLNRFLELDINEEQTILDIIIESYLNDDFTKIEKNR